MLHWDARRKVTLNGAIAKALDGDGVLTLTQVRTKTCKRRSASEGREAKEERTSHQKPVVEIRQLALPFRGGSPLDHDEVWRRCTKYTYSKGVLRHAVLKHTA